MRSAVVIPNWNGARWLVGCLDAVAAQTRAPDEVVVVDNGSSDDSLAILAAHPAGPRVIEVGENLGFGAAANRGIAATDAEAVALINTDVVLAEDWLEGALAALADHPRAAAVATKMVTLADPGQLDDTGDFLGRDGAAIQRGKFRRDDGGYDEPGEVWGACAGAALYRRDAVLAVGGFDERYFMYLEDVDLALRLRMAGWECRYQPVVARHASEGSSRSLSRGLTWWVARNTVLLTGQGVPGAVGAAGRLPPGGHGPPGRPRGPPARVPRRARGGPDAAAVDPRASAPSCARTARCRVEQAVPDRPIRGPPRSGIRAAPKLGAGAQAPWRSTRPALRSIRRATTPTPSSDTWWATMPGYWP